MENIARLDLSPQTSDSAGEQARQVLDTAQKQVGFIPNMYANMVNSPGVLHTYLVGYKHFREESGLTPAEQEVVFLAISRENECDYCMAAHSMIADKVSKVPADAIESIRTDTVIADAKLQALAEFTRIMFRTRGRPTPDDVSAFRAAGFSDRHVLEIILALAVKTLSNYSNHVFHTEVDQRFSAYAWQPQPA